MNGAPELGAFDLTVPALARRLSGMTYKPWPPAPGNPNLPPQHAHQQHPHQQHPHPHQHQQHGHQAYPPPPYRTQPTAGQGPSQDDRSFAAMAYASPFVGACIAGPIAIYLWKRNASPYVRNHAAQAVFISLSAVGAWFLNFAVSIGVGAAGADLSPAAMAALVYGSYLGLMLFCFALMVLSVIGGLKAYQGERWSIPVIGTLSRWILGTSER